MLLDGIINIDFYFLWILDGTRDIKPDCVCQEKPIYDENSTERFKTKSRHEIELNWMNVLQTTLYYVSTIILITKKHFHRVQAQIVHLINIEDLTCAHVLLNLLNELGKKIRCEALSIILSVFPNAFNIFSNTWARMQDSIYHMTLKSHFISKFCTKTSQFLH